jgi:hypothetical protein
MNGKKENSKFVRKFMVSSDVDVEKMYASCVDGFLVSMCP